jgi:hypothetical protein
VILDDDDELRPDALRTIGMRLGELPAPERYLAFHFCNGNGALDVRYQLVRVPDLWGGVRRGNFVSVWNRELRLEDGCRYPETPVGGEGLVWIDVALRYGIPTWADRVGIVHTDAGARLSTLETQLHHAGELARIQNRVVASLAPHQSNARVYREVTRRLFASGVYSLLAGERRDALVAARTLTFRDLRLALKLALGACLPSAALRSFVRARRRGREAWGVAAS